MFGTLLRRWSGVPGSLPARNIERVSNVTRMRLSSGTYRRSDALLTR
jgi:hypothetical protein